MSDQPAMRPLRVAVLGCGVVGSAVVRLLTETRADLAARVGRPLELVGVGVRRAGRNRTASGIDEALFTTDSHDLVTRADLVVEVIGGIEPARSLILRAMEHGASVVTANKALLAEDGPTLYAAAAQHGVDLYYEAAVAGAIPLLRPLRESLAGDSVRRVLGIVNGTTNYVLDKMDSSGAGFSEAVEQAQALGYAEADPTADVEGFDAAAKAAILASLAFHTRVRGSDVHREGITEVSATDVQSAKDMDCVVKLLAICERTTDASGLEGVSVRVHPALIPRSHPLAGVREAFNAVFVEADAAGQLMFYGRGAGGDPTASAVLGDLVAVARHRVLGGRAQDRTASGRLVPVSRTGLCLILLRHRLKIGVAGVWYYMVPEMQAVPDGTSHVKQSLIERIQTCSYRSLRGRHPGFGCCSRDWSHWARRSCATGRSRAHDCLYCRSRWCCCRCSRRLPPSSFRRRRC